MACNLSKLVGTSYLFSTGEPFRGPIRTLETNHNCQTCKTVKASISALPSPSNRGLLSTENIPRQLGFLAVSSSRQFRSTISSCSSTRNEACEVDLTLTAGKLQEEGRGRNKVEEIMNERRDAESRVQTGQVLRSLVILDVSLLLPPLDQLGFNQDIITAVFVSLGALLWVRIFDELMRFRVLEQKLSRKLVHITTGLVFMLTWPLFSEAPEARIYVALVPLANAVKLLLLALGITKDEAAVRSISREGNPRELLRGPMFYVIAFISNVVFFWRNSPVGIVAMALMCAGDGVADIVGRRYGSEKLPWNRNKSWAGSMAMFAAGLPLSLLFISYFSGFGYFECDWWSTVWRVAIITFCATLVESLPITEKLDDNLTVPLTAALFGSLLFPGSFISPF